MTIESLSPQLIERYLDSRDLRFYRDSDGKGFLVLFSTAHSKLHVNLRAGGKRGDVLVISVSPAAHYELLMSGADRATARRQARERVRDVSRAWREGLATRRFTEAQDRTDLPP